MKTAVLSPLYHTIEFLQIDRRIIWNMLKATCCMAEVLIRHVYSAFSAAFVAYIRQSGA